MFFRIKPNFTECTPSTYPQVGQEPIRSIKSINLLLVLGLAQNFLYRIRGWQKERPKCKQSKPIKSTNYTPEESFFRAANTMLTASFFAPNQCPILPRLGESA